MLARYRKTGVKKFQFGNSHIVVESENWTPITDVRVFMKLQEHPKVFDTIKFFDYRPLIPHAKKIKIEKDLLFSKDNLTVDKLKKLHFLKYQAYKSTGEHVFKIVNLLLLVIYSTTCCSGMYIDMLLLRTTLTLLFNAGRSRIFFRIFYEIGLGIPR